MPRKPKISWTDSAVFAVPLPDGSFGVGQAITLMWPNVVYCALTECRISVLQAGVPAIQPSNVVARVALSREQLDYGAWPVLGTALPLAAKGDFVNEQFAAAGYVGAKVYDASLAEDFLAAFHALAPWDDWHDPKYLDTWLVAPERRPRVLKFKVNAPAT